MKMNMNKPPVNCVQAIEMMIEFFERKRFYDEKTLYISFEDLKRFATDENRTWLILDWLKDEKIIDDFSIYDPEDYRYSGEYNNGEPMPFGKVIFDSRKDILQMLKSGLAKTTIKQRVYFDRSNGALIVDGDIVVVVNPNSSQFFMIDLLDKNFNESIDHKTIYSYCTKKMGKEFKASSEGFVNNQKGAIKKLSNKKKLIDQILICKDTFDGDTGIRLTNP